MVPDGWELATTGNIAKSIVPGRNKPKSFTGDIPWITMPAMIGRFVPSPSHHLFVSKEELSHAGGKIVPTNSVIMSCVGELGIVARNSVPVVLNQQLHAFVPNSAVESAFLAYQLANSTAEMLARASKTTIPYLNKSNCESLPVLLPPRPEQKKIAEILSTWDGAIETTEKLLANAESQKRALMQQFLDQTSWPLIKIGDLGTIRSAGVDKKEVEGERSVRLLNYLDVLRRDQIFADELDHWVTAPDRQIESCDIRKGDVFFTPSSETRDDIGHSAVAMEDIPDAAYSYHIVRFRPSAEMDLAYSAYAFKSKHFYHQCYSYCEGSGQRYVISQDYFRSFSISFPPIDRQREIGRMLATFDKMIAKYSKDLRFLRNEKRALVQQLLTGKRRVTI